MVRVRRRLIGQFGGGGGRRRYVHKYLSATVIPSRISTWKIMTEISNQAKLRQTLAPLLHLNNKPLRRNRSCRLPPHLQLPPKRNSQTTLRHILRHLQNSRSSHRVWWFRRRPRRSLSAHLGIRTSLPLRRRTVLRLSRVRTVASCC